MLRWLFFLGVSLSLGQGGQGQGHPTTKTTMTSLPLTPFFEQFNDCFIKLDVPGAGNITVVVDLGSTVAPIIRLSIQQEELYRLRVKAWDHDYIRGHVHSGIKHIFCVLRVLFVSPGLPQGSTVLKEYLMNIYRSQGSLTRNFQRNSYKWTNTAAIHLTPNCTSEDFQDLLRSPWSSSEVSQFMSFILCYEQVPDDLVGYDHQGEFKVTSVHHFPRTHTHYGGHDTEDEFDHGVDQIREIPCRDNLKSCRQLMETYGDLESRKFKELVGVVASEQRRGRFLEFANNVVLPNHPHFSFLKGLTQTRYFFEHRDNLSHVTIVQGILFEHINGTTAYAFKFGIFKGGLNFDLKNEGQALPNPTLPFIHVMNVKVNQLTEYHEFVLVANVFFNFATCHGLHQVNAFRYYVTPLDGGIWAGVIVCLVTLTFLLKFGLSGGGWATPFYTISVILENGFGPLQLKPLRSSRFIESTTFLSLALISLIIGNLYKSVITTDIISPLPWMIPVSKFGQLENFSFAVLPVNQHTVNWLKNRKVIGSGSNRDKDEGERMRLPGPGLKFGIFEFSLLGTSEFGRKVRDALDSRAWKVKEGLKPNPEEIEIIRLGQDVRIFASSKATVPFLSKCEGMALIGRKEEIDFMLRSSGGVKIGLQGGKDSFYAEGIYWALPYALGEFLQRRFQAIISSGIYGFWEGVGGRIRRTELTIDKRMTIETQQSLDTSLGAFLVIFGVGLGTTMGVFCMEIIVVCPWKCTKFGRVLTFYRAIRRKTAVFSNQTYSKNS